MPGDCPLGNTWEYHSTCLNISPCAGLFPPEATTPQADLSLSKGGALGRSSHGSDVGVRESLPRGIPKSWQSGMMPNNTAHHILQHNIRLQPIMPRSVRLNSSSGILSGHLSSSYQAD
jgi:hypothetical protein